MAGYKETPRQKMIGMMYLVLTALLALNVSKQIMDAFLVVNESMETTNINFSKKLDDVYSKFQKQYSLNPNKVGPNWHKAEQAHAMSIALENYVDSIKFIVIQRTDKLETLKEAKNINLRNVERKDNYDIPTRFFIGSSEDGTTSGEGRILKEKIENYKKQMLELVDSKNIANIKVGMNTKGPFKDADGKSQNWQMHNFYRTILAATVTILNKIKADIYNLEFDVINNLYASVTEEDWKFEGIRARVIPRSQYVFLGDRYQAEILVTAFDTKQNPKVKYMFGTDTLTEQNYSNATPLEGMNGIVPLDIPATSEGIKKFAGVIQIISPSGITKDFHFHDEFIVAKRSISISPTQMLVFYRGIPNPVKIGFPGGASDPQANITFGTIARSDTNWVVEIPPTGGPANNRVVVTVSAVYGGKRIQLGSESFRLKTIPPPVVLIAGVPEGSIAKNLIQGNPYLVCNPPPGFDLNVKFNVISFTFSTTDSQGDYKEVQIVGKYLNAQALNYIKTARKKQVIWLDEIKVQGPGGTMKVDRTTKYTLK